MTNQPWTCPRCSRIYGPQALECPKCNERINLWGPGGAFTRAFGLPGDPMGVPGNYVPEPDPLEPTCGYAGCEKHGNPVMYTDGLRFRCEDHAPLPGDYEAQRTKSTKTPSQPLQTLPEDPD